MNEIIKFRKWQYRAVIGIIALILIPVNTSFKYGLIDSLYAGQVGGSKAGSASLTGRRKLVSAKIACTQIIKEDYEGLKLSYPSEVLVDPVKKEIYVVDSGNNRILIYASDFYPLLSIGKTYGINSPTGLAIDPEGYLFVAQSKGKMNKRGRISVLSPSLGRKKDIFFKGFEGAGDFTPSNIAISNRGYIYLAGSVAGSPYRGAVVMDKEGTFSHLLTPVDRSLGKYSDEKATICDVEIDKKGNIYLLSEDMGRIYVYDSHDRYLFKFGQKGGSTGKLSRPRGIAVDSDGERIYVIDYMRHTANAYSGDGQFLFEFGGKGWGKGWFQYPTDIAVDTLGNVLVVDTFNNRVQVLKIQEVPSIEKVKEPKPKVTIAKKVPEAKIPEHYFLTSNMNLREESNTDSNIIKELRKGEEFQILDEDKRGKLYHWYYIVKVKKKVISDNTKVNKVKQENQTAILTQKTETDKKYAIQVASFKDSKDADEMVASLKKKGYPAYRISSNIPEKGVWHRVRIGSFKDKAEAGSTLNKLKKEKYSPIMMYRIETRPGLKGWFCGIYNGKAMFKRKFDESPSKTGYVKEQKTITATIIKECAKELQIPAEEASEDDKKKQGIVPKESQIAEDNSNQEVETGRLKSAAKMVVCFFLFIGLFVLILKRLKSLR